MATTAEPFSVFDQPGFILRRAATVMMDDLARRLAKLDLRISDATVLMLVDKRTDMTSTEIGRVLDIQRANMVPLLNRLAAADLIERRPIDRKSQAIVLTAHGRKTLTKTRRLVERFESDLLDRIAPDQRDAFVGGLRTLIA